MPTSHISNPPEANGVRVPLCFSEAVTPRRVIVLDVHGRVAGTGQLLARNTLMGRLIGHLVAMDDGMRVTIAPVQLREIDNVVVPPPTVWGARRGGCRL